jgi:hypothetical protein
MELGQACALKIPPFEFIGKIQIIRQMNRKILSSLKANSRALFSKVEKVIQSCSSSDLVARFILC